MKVEDMKVKGTELYMLLYTVQIFHTLENPFNCTFIYIHEEKSDNIRYVQISYSDIRKIEI